MMYTVVTYEMLMILVALRNIFLLIKSDIKLRMDEVNTKRQELCWQAGGTGLMVEGEWVW